MTRSELEKSDLLYDQGEINDENWGDFEMRLDRGTVRMELRNSVGLWVAEGTVEVQDDVLTLTFTSGIDAGEEFAMRWSLYRDELKLARDESVGIGPTPFVIDTWHRGS